MGFDGKGMDVMDHHVAQRRIDSPVARQRRLARKSRAGDPHAVMATAITGTRVSSMEMAVIGNHQLGRSQGRFKQFADPLQPAQGNTLRNGRTSTRA